MYSVTTLECLGHESAQRLEAPRTASENILCRFMFLKKLHSYTANDCLRLGTVSGFAFFLVRPSKKKKKKNLTYQSLCLLAACICACKQATFSHYSQCKAPRVPHAPGTLALTPHVGQTENKTGKHPSHSDISTVSAVIYLISMLVMRASPSTLMTEYFSAPMRFWKWMMEPSDRATWNSSRVNVMTTLGGGQHCNKWG